MIDNLIDMLQKDLKLKNPIPRVSQGVYKLPVTENSSVTISDLSPGVSFRLALGNCPNKDIEETYTYLLKANLFGEGTFGGVLGLDSDAKQVIYSMDIDYDIDYEEFSKKLEDFINGVEFWENELKKMK